MPQIADYFCVNVSCWQIERNRSYIGGRENREFPTIPIVSPNQIRSPNEMASNVELVKSAWIKSSLLWDECETTNLLMTMISHSSHNKEDAVKSEQWCVARIAGAIWCCAAQEENVDQRLLLSSYSMQWYMWGDLDPALEISGEKDRLSQQDWKRGITVTFIPKYTC